MCDDIVHVIPFAPPQRQKETPKSLFACVSSLPLLSLFLRPLEIQVSVLRLLRLLGQHSEGVTEAMSDALAQVLYLQAFAGAHVRNASFQDGRTSPATCLPGTTFVVRCVVLSLLTREIALHCTACSPESIHAIFRSVAIALRILDSSCSHQCQTKQTKYISPLFSVE